MVPNVIPTDAPTVTPTSTPPRTPTQDPKPKTSTASVSDETRALLQRLQQQLQKQADPEKQNDPPRNAPLKIDFDLNGPKGLITNDEEPPSFDTLEQEWKWWHDKLKHPPTQRMQRLIALGLLPARLKKLHKPPKCAGCLTWKATKKPWRVKGKQSSTIKEATYCGECVSVDQLDATTPGFIAQLKGILTRRRYRYATIFVDHFSRVDYVVPQMSLTSEETVKAKHSFEVWAASHGVKVKHYHADNGRFQDNAWKGDCEVKGQGVTYCGVGAHWQNGIAEKRIRDLNDMATVILNYAQRKWPQAISTHLWPYALRAASDTGNSLPRLNQQQSPIEIFSNVKVRPNLRHHHPFGCPVYVLDGKLQSGQKAGKKWTDRARLGVNLGFSPQHSKSVALVLSLTTGLVSPQFHCQFDEAFQTVRGIDASLQPPSLWQEKAYFVKPKESAPPSISEQPQLPTGTVLPPPSTDSAITQPSEDQLEAQQEPLQQSVQPTRERHRADSRTSPPSEPAVEPAVTTRTGRAVRPPKRFDDFVAFEALQAPIAELNPHPVISFKANADPDTMYYHEAMRAPDAKQFREAMQKEVDDHTSRGHWQIVRVDELPTGTRILPAVWSMKRKRKIATQEIYRWKARITVDGSKQRYGVDYDETYSPVITWPAARFFLILSLVQGWHSRQLDFVLAYPQADVERELYMEIPRGIEIPGVERGTYALKLIKNLYGQRQAGRVWYNHLTSGLKNLGFKQSAVDECVFYYKRSVFLVYVDDTILLGPDAAELDAIMQLLQSRFNVESEGDLGDYLGIQLRKFKQDNKTLLELTQPQLIQSILADLNLLPNRSHAVKSKPTPALCSKILTKDPKDPKFDNSFNYRRVIGKLLYLEKSSRPELAYAVHQCARFSNDPRRSHGEAVKRIGRYLAGTADKGMILNPSDTASFDCWVDASHAAEWNRSTAVDDAATAKSRMGYVVLYANCPLLWSSKLQTEIALSSTEAEYIALSQSMREVIPLMALMKEAQQMRLPIRPLSPKIHCKVFEDNTGAIEIAKVPKMRPRTKHLNIKYHHFRSFVLDGSISVHHVSTDQQVADIFTKPLNQDAFERHRKSLVGW
jgi:hypothetical protein